jgi:hypothetical protein
MVLKMDEVKYGLLYYLSGNIGDDIQSIAARQFLPKVDYYLDRDSINKYNKKSKTKIILNGWFSLNPPVFPLKNSIVPLFISFHITPNHKDKLTDTESINYYKKYEPIGCRDYYTVDLLKNKGVESYYSGCLTLTLKNNVQKNNKIYFVDVDDNITKKLIDKNIEANHTTHLLKFPLFQPKPFRDIIYKLPANFFWRYYFILRLKKAQKLLDLYAKAKLVITSRLHCALPCLAFGTPVILIHDNIETDPRFDPLIDLINHYSKRDIMDGNYEINLEEPKSNPSNIQYIKNSLSKKCKKFIDTIDENFH